MSTEITLKDNYDTHFILFWLKMICMITSVCRKYNELYDHLYVQCYKNNFRCSWDILWFEEIFQSLGFSLATASLNNVRCTSNFNYVIPTVNYIWKKYYFHFQILSLLRGRYWLYSEEEGSTIGEGIQKERRRKTEKRRKPVCSAISGEHA